MIVKIIDAEELKLMGIDLSIVGCVLVIMPDDLLFDMLF